MQQSRCGYRLILLSTVLVTLVGCSSSEPTTSKKSIFKQRTQDVGEFDPQAGKEVSDSRVRVTSPLLGGAEAYGPLAEKVAKLGVEQNLNIYYAVNGRYPKDHDEFMREIIKKNNLQLPKLPDGNRYEYDVENHKLIVVKAKTKAAGAGTKN